ncbi:MAG TPA: hypothetical protein VKE25_12960 [Actinomycetes bacterium]|nr:hypothetical protein [Actinomycetes bacterium]
MRPAKIAILAALPLLLAGLTGCGSDADGSTSGAGSTNSADSAEPDRQEQMLKFTECLREHGLDVPDPDSEGRFAIPFGGGSGNGPDQKTREAMEACQELAPLGGGNLDELRNDPEFQDAQLRFAECMRQHGVDVPDPDEDGGGGFMIDGSDVPRETLRAAGEACDPIMQEFLQGRAQGGEGM